jgi:hypothetical protein
MSSLVWPKASSKTRTIIAQACRDRPACSEAPAGQCAATTCYGSIDDVLVLPVELELGNIRRQIFGGNPMIGAHDAAFDEGPESAGSADFPAAGSGAFPG